MSSENAVHGCLVLKEKAGGVVQVGSSDLDRYGHGALPLLTGV